MKVADPNGRRIVDYKYLKEFAGSMVPESSIHPEQALTYSKLKEILTPEHYVESDYSDSPKKIRIYKFNHSEPYIDNQVVIRRDLEIVGSNRTLTNLEFVNEDMDPMGGIRLGLIKHYSDGSKEYIGVNSNGVFNNEDQNKFTVTDSILKDKLFIDGKQFTKHVTKNVNSNIYKQNKSIKFTFEGKEYSRNVKQSGEEYGVYINGKDKLNSNSWKSRESFDDFGGADKDWYIKDTTDYTVQGTIIPNSPIPGADKYHNKFYTGMDDRSIQPRPRHISWIEGPANNRWIYDEESFYISSDYCSGTTVESKNLNRNIVAIYRIDYFKPKHNYGRYSINYLESYPEEYHKDNYPVNIQYYKETSYIFPNIEPELQQYNKVVNPSRSSKNLTIDSANTYPNSLSYIDNDVLIMPSVVNGKLNSDESDNTEPERKYIIYYSFLSKEICKREGNEIVLDTDGSETIFNDKLNKEFKYNVLSNDITYTKQKADGVVLRGVGSNPSIIFCDDHWNRENIIRYIYKPENEGISWAIQHKTYSIKENIPTVVKNEDGTYWYKNPNESKPIQLKQYWAYYITTPYNSKEVSYYSCRPSTIKTDPERIIEYKGKKYKGTITIDDVKDITAKVYSGYSHLPVKITVTSGNGKLESTVEGTTPGANARGNINVTFEELSQMGYNLWDRDTTGEHKDENFD